MGTPVQGGSSPNAGLPPRPNESAAGRRVLIDEELVDSVAWLIRLRWIASLGVIATVWFVSLSFRLEFPFVPLMIIGGIVFLYNIVFYLINRHFKKNKRIGRILPQTGFRSGGF